MQPGSGVAVATAPIQPLAQELPYAPGAALNKQNKTKQNKTPIDLLRVNGLDLTSLLPGWTKG